MKEITLDELEKSLNWAKTSVDTKEALKKLESLNQVTVLSDYDADGICSAYIMKKTLEAMGKDVEVKINDRRNGYGINDKLLEGVKGDLVVLDMGINSLDKLDKFGNVLVVDHHIKENDTPYDKNKITVLHNEDMCASGLCKCLADHKDFGDRTLDIMACLGTIADSEDAKNKMNYNLIANGLNAINNADKNNIDFQIGYFLAQSVKTEKYKVRGGGISDGEYRKGKLVQGVTRKELQFDVIPVLNAMSRIGADYDVNGAQYTFDALAGDKTANLLAIKNLYKANDIRKEKSKELKKTKSLTDLIANPPKDDIVQYELPNGTNSAYCGLIASHIFNKTGKAALCYTLTDDGYVGSGRGEGGLKDFIDKLPVEGGGHENACGFSFTDKDSFIREFNKNAPSFKIEKDPVILKLTKEEMADTDFLNKVERISNFADIPPVKFTISKDDIEGIEEGKKPTIYLKEDKLNYGTNFSPYIPHHKLPIEITDWNYKPENWKGDNITFYANMSINSYIKTHIHTIEFTRIDDPLQKEKTKENIERDD